MSVNQAVIFTNPVHHLRAEISPEKLNQRLRCFFEPKGFRFIVSKKVTGADLKKHDVIKQHYLMYSAAACAETLHVTEDAKNRFEDFFGKTWMAELDAGLIVPMPRLLERTDVNVHQLFSYWRALLAAGKTVKLQAGFIMGFVGELGSYAINAFYPSMEAVFYHPDTVLHYHVVEFDSSQTSWQAFRRDLLGKTNARDANPESFRGQLYRDAPSEFPERDNYVHGSAGPLEGFVERTIHEDDFEITTSPVGAFLAARGVTLQSFSRWRTKQSLATLGNLFDETEEKNTDEIFQIMQNVDAVPSRAKP
jgi:hypothetical protein